MKKLQLLTNEIAVLDLQQNATICQPILLKSDALMPIILQLYPFLLRTILRN